MRGVRLLDNRVLSEVEIQAAASPYLDQVVGLVELLEIRSRLQQLVQEKGYITTQVTLVAGEAIAEGAVTYRVVEGRLGEIRLEGLQPALNILFSTGIGLRWQVRESLLLEVNYGIPLSRTERGVESSWQNQGINFRFQLGTSF